MSTEPRSTTPTGRDSRPHLDVGMCPVPGYELIALLGEGGYGEVWKAKGPGGFAVALKFIRLGHKAGETELRSLALMKDIRHAHLLSQFGAWQRESYLIVAMELGERTLMHRLHEACDQGLPGIPFDELLQCMRDAARGLDYLNELGIQHRDIKPQNLLLVGGCVKVADFGLAKLVEHTASTNSGSMTPAYAAPEFFQNQTFLQSDQYSLAVSYCQLRGGRLPFGGNAAQQVAGHLMQPPDLTMLPESERSVLVRALSKQAFDRWPSCGDFVEAVSLTGAQRQERDPNSAGTHRIPVEDPHASQVKATMGRVSDQTMRISRRSFVGLRRPALLLGALLAVSMLIWRSEWVGSRDMERVVPEAQRITNSIGIEMVLIPAGSFEMGSPLGEEDRVNDEELHDVTITKPFYLGVYEVTQEQYENVMRANPSAFSSWKHGAEAKDFPVENVSWDDAQEFCERLTYRPGEKKTDYKYRLPTEAQWEYACRGGAAEYAVFHYGNALSWTQANFDGSIPYARAAAGRNLEKTTKVGYYEPNAFGLFDMHGNVWEWCQDWYGANYYRTRIWRDPPGPNEGARRIIRGGCWRFGAQFCRAAQRSNVEPSHRSSTLGFRVARVPIGE